jgi:DNA-binding transcriptional LysR family regulator
MNMFELSQLRCFVAVAEELHFGRAAQRLNMTQPPLSRQVQLLERILGVVLLDRTSRSVRLTPAGRSFLIEARRILRLAESAALATRRIARATPGGSRSGSRRPRATASCPNSSIWRGRSCRMST